MSKIIPGEIKFAQGDIELNAGRKKKTLSVANTGDRPIQVGSHIHFVETNRQLSFDRKETIGMRLDIPAGTAVRFEPGQETEVVLTDVGGNREVFGISNLTNGSVDESEKIMEKVHKMSFKGAD